MSLLQEPERPAVEQITCPIGGCIKPEKCAVLKRAIRNIGTLPNVNISAAIKMAVEGARHDKNLPHNSLSPQICAVAVV